MAGRGANELATSLYKLLKLIIQDCPNISINQIILWSDSCVPQNKNSIVSTAIKNFQNESGIPLIEQKYSEPGHSSV